jgi:hypothetical protein
MAHGGRNGEKEAATCHVNDRRESLRYGAGVVSCWLKCGCSGGG